MGAGSSAADAVAFEGADAAPADAGAFEVADAGPAEGGAAEAGTVSGAGGTPYGVTVGGEEQAARAPARPAASSAARGGRAVAQNGHSASLA